LGSIGVISEELAMAHTHDLNIKLSDEAVEFIRGKVSSGEYSSESDVISESLEVLKRETEERERWEREVLIPAHDHFMANPSSGIPLKEVERGLEARRRQRSQAR
jgi:antitoxin ParD1/3/4